MKNYRNHPACVFHRAAKQILILGGEFKGQWSDKCSILLINKDTSVEINIKEMPYAIFGPAACIPDPDKKELVAYVVGNGIEHYERDSAFFKLTMIDY